MHWLAIALRFVHVVSGTLWVGMMLFTTVFLAPALRDAGPESGKVMAALQKRGLMTVMPILALLTLISGVWLLERHYGGMAVAMASRLGAAFVIGGAAALVAFLLGIVVLRPAMARAAASTDQAEIARLRARGAAVGRIVALLLVFALGAMAVARYL